jgi:acyl carrier protein
MTTESVADVSSTSSMRQFVREAWIDVLGDDRFADVDRFFDIDGGDSLTAVQVMVTMSSRLASPLAVRLILTHPTVEELAAAIAKEVVGARLRKIVAEVLDIPEPELTDSFYDHSGTSLQALRVCVRLESELGLVSDPVDLLDHDVLADFVTVVLDRSSPSRA